MNILGFKMYDYNINTHSYFKLPEYDPMCACTACIMCTRRDRTEAPATTLFGIKMSPSNPAQISFHLNAN